MSYHNTGRNLTQNKAAVGNGLTYSKGTFNGATNKNNTGTLEIYAGGAQMGNPHSVQADETALDIVLRRLRGV